MIEKARPPLKKKKKKKKKNEEEKKKRGEGGGGGERNSRKFIGGIRICIEVKDGFGSKRWYSGVISSKTYPFF